MDCTNRQLEVTDNFQDGSVLTKREDCPGCTEAFHMLANAAPVKELKEPTADVHRVEQAPQVKRADCARCDATYDDCMAKTCDAAPPSDPDACKQHCVHLTCALPENVSHPTLCASIKVTVT